VKHGPRIETRPVGPGDDALLREVFAVGRRAGLLAAGLGEREVGLLVEMQYRAQDAQYRAAFPEAEHAVVEVDDTPVGRLVVDRRLGEMRIVDVGFVAECRGRGFGTRLLESLQAEAARTGRLLGLRVARDNPARRLYARLGFREAAADEMYVEMVWDAEARGRVKSRRRSNRGAAA
jgi:ribosomal protein S18 acetylase RimI-like enzyme